MILDTLTNAGRYDALHPLFAEAFRFLSRDDLSTLKPGRYEIDGERLFAMIAKGPARRAEEAQLEVHDRYIDIQYVIAGNDVMGWRPRGECAEVARDLLADGDLLFFAEAPRTWFSVDPGAFAVFFPEDAHLPMTGEGEIHKVVVKVAVAAA